MDANTCTTCGKSKDVSSSEHCSGHESAVDLKDLKSQLDAIPTPKVADTPAPKPPDTKEPAAAAPKLTAGGGVGAVSSDQLNAIPTPGLATPTPAKPPEQNPGEVPEWQKKFNSYQSSMTSSTPYTVPDGGFTSPAGQTNYQPAGGGGGYMMIAAFVVILAIAVLGIAMMKTVPPASFDQPSTTTSSPSSTTTPTP